MINAELHNSEGFLAKLTMACKPAKGETLTFGLTAYKVAEVVHVIDALVDPSGNHDQCIIVYLEIP
jgi:hypothetical protein